MNSIVLNNSCLPVVISVIAIPIVAGILLFVFPERIKTFKGVISLIVSAFTLYLSHSIFAQRGLSEIYVMEAISTGNGIIDAFLVLISIIPGIFIYLAGNIKNFRTADSFIGGEKLQDETGFSSTEFYNTIANQNIFSFIYKKQKKSYLICTIY